MTVQIANELSVEFASVGKGQRGKDLRGTVKEEAVGALRQARAFETHVQSLYRQISGTTRHIVFV